VKGNVLQRIEPLTFYRVQPPLNAMAQQYLPRDA
jgi:hypothetical protein